MSDVYSVDVEVTAPVKPTEVRDRVADAITNLFPGADVEWSVPPAGGVGADGERGDDDPGDEERDDAPGHGGEAGRSGELVARTHSMDHFAELLREQEILDTARGQFLEGRRGDTVTVALKKQAAFQGVVNFAVGSPDELGDIHVSVRVHDPDVESFVRQLAPPTEEGVPVDDEGA